MTKNHASLLKVDEWLEEKEAKVFGNFSQMNHVKLPIFF